MKRFYKTAEAIAAADGTGFAIHLDGRPVRTPGKAVLELPNAKLAQMVAAEWNDAGEKIDVGSMVFTGLAKAAIDHVTGNPDHFRQELLGFGDTDTLCYRAEPEDALLLRQDELWEPLTQWAEATFGVRLNRISGVMHRPHPPETAARYAELLSGQTPFQLVGMSRIAALSGSLIIALAAGRPDHDPDDLWRASNLEENWQAELWGKDSDAEAVREARRQVFLGGVRFLRAASEA